MKNNKGDVLVTVIMTIVVILIVVIIAFFIYEFVFLNQEKTQVASGSSNIENSIEINNMAENIENNNTMKDIETNNDIQNAENNVIENTVLGTLNNEQQEVIVPIFNEITEPIIEDTNANKNEEYILSRSYYYNQLDKYGKIIYDKIKNNQSKLITGTYVFDFETSFNTLLHEQNGKEKLAEAFQSAWNAFSYDITELFYLDVTKMTLTSESQSIGGITTYYVSIGPGNNSNYLKDEFQTKEGIIQAREYIENIVSQIIEQTRQKSDEEKASLIHDWLIDVVEYEESELDSNRHDIYGTLYKKKAVCEGYARTYKYLMEQVGVPCVLVSGEGKNSEGITESHAWNYVQVNHKWYAVDITWDDPIIIGEGTIDKNIKRKYFLKGSDTFFDNHVEDGTISGNSIEFKFPTLSEIAYIE